jgi:hypothetical protein
MSKVPSVGAVIDLRVALAKLDQRVTAEAAQQSVHRLVGTRLEEDRFLPARLQRLRERAQQMGVGVVDGGDDRAREDRPAQARRGRWAVHSDARVVAEDGVMVGVVLFAASRLAPLFLSCPLSAVLEAWTHG